MANPSTTFLPNPGAIRKAIYALQRQKRLDLAVAFVGADWEDLLAEYRGQIRLICWLSSTNTNPYAVENLIENRVEVKQRHSMHCKVYIAPRFGAVVGSANLSKAALAEGDTSGQDEAAVFVSERAILSVIQRWFKTLWEDEDTRVIKDADLRAAKAAWDARPRSAPKGTGRRTSPRIPIPVTPDSRIQRYAARVRSIDLRKDLEMPVTVLSSVDPSTLTPVARNAIIDQLVSWTGHPASYNRFRQQPISQARRGLEILFDNSRDLEERLTQLTQHEYLEGLQIPSMSLLLHWRHPEIYIPFNARTIRFLEDFKMRHRGMSSASPICYAAWLRFATRLAQQYGLPRVGHVDRMVNLYYEENY